MAKAIHANYLADQMVEQVEGHPAMKPWDALDEGLRAQNRSQARDNLAKLRSIGLRVVPGEAESGRGAGLSPEQVERLARLEHDRWAHQKGTQGYRYGPERIDDGPDKRHPDMREWSELSGHVRDKDRTPIRRMIDVLATAGFTVEPVGSGSDCASNLEG